VIWLWTSHHAASRAVRAGLAPVAALYGVAMRARRRAYGRPWPARHRLPLPSVSVGSLQVGGAGKTPIASWIAGWFVARGARPAILLRGYGGDEGAVHRELVPSALVLEDPHRIRSAQQATKRGADVLVLDDAFQHLRIRPDRSILLIAAEACTPGFRLLPAGPWREGIEAAQEADVLVVTSKTASRATIDRVRSALHAAAPAVPQANARLTIAGWRTLAGTALDAAALRSDTPVMAVSGIADPQAFLRQVRSLACVRASLDRRDHARYDTRCIKRIARAAETAKVDYVVTTAKDAVKLRGRWPQGAPPVLVAQLTVRWEHGFDAVARTLLACDERRGHGVPFEERQGSATRLPVAGKA
jgi:tetraacyldisaccharide 4'-kinase